MVSSLQETINSLKNKTSKILNSDLSELSDLSTDELQVFKEAWQGIELRRRRQIMNRLVDIAEDNPELSFDGIFRLCLRDNDAAIRAKAIEGLWENEDPSLIDSLVSLLNEDSSQAVQSAAALSLGRFAMMAELGKLRSKRSKQVTDFLTSVIDNTKKSSEVRRRALESAAPLNSKRVRKAITAAYESNDTKLKASAIYAMGKNCDPGWMNILLNELESETNEFRYEAAGACGEMGEKEAVPFLVKLVNDKDVDIQLVAIQALAKIGGPDAQKCLKRCLNSTNAAVKEAAEQGLYQLKLEQDPLSFQIDHNNFSYS
jgi:HEAT repeat protein